MKKHAMRFLYGSIPVSIIGLLSYIYYLLGLEFDEDYVVMVVSTFILIYFLGALIEKYRNGDYKNL